LKKIVYIAGLGHSGSTILDMALGANPQMVGLGEIYAVFNSKNYKDLFENSTCSCGKKGADCSFWKNVRTLSESNLTTEEKYLQIIELFSEKYGDDMILVDSSKNSYPYLNMLNEKFDLRIIYLTRDYRSWAYSRSSRIKTPLFILFLRWFFENKKLMHILNKNKFNILKVGYEELAFFPEFILKKVSEFIDVRYSDLMLSPANTKSHIINGNIARADKQKKEKFFYDPKWLVSGKLNFISAFFSFFQKFNNSLVYSNIMKGKVKAFGKNSFDFHIFGKKIGTA
jgi:hypothetical protein